MTKPSDERYTPPHVLEVIAKVAPIMLDPCCGPGAPTGHARYYFDGSSLGSGLDLPWWGLASGGLVFVNPPYSHGQLKLWVTKCVMDAEFGCEIIALLPNDLGTRWGQHAFATCQGIAFWHGRIAFGTPEHPAGQARCAKQPSMFVYWGERVERFSRVFSPHACVVTRGGWR